MTARSWIGRLFVRTARRTPQGSRQAPPRFRPTLDVLEDRLTPSTLGTTALLEGPAAGSDSDLVIASGPWSDVSNTPWLHTSSTGTGNGLATLTFDANPGATRSGTLTIAGLTLTVTQAGSPYVAANLVSLVSSGMSGPGGVAVDGAGNVFIADTSNSAIKKWDPSTQTVLTLVSDGLDTPEGVAVDGAGNVFIADTGHFAIKKWSASTHTVSTLFSVTEAAFGVAVDGAGNVYVANLARPNIKKWDASTQTVSTLVSDGLSGPKGVAVDGAGNVYIADSFDNAIKKWDASTHVVSTLVSSGLSLPAGVAVDGSGNVIFSDTGNGAIKEWDASTQTVTTLVSSGLNSPQGVAVDGAGNVFIADSVRGGLKELPRAFVPGGVVLEGPAAGTDALLPVVPASQPLTGAFAPRSDQSWLTVDSVANGVVHFSCTDNTGFSSRTGHLSVLGRQIAVTQAASPTQQTPPTQQEGSAAGSDQVPVVSEGAWTATANDPWLHTSASGTGNDMATFTFDANPGVTRIGTLTIAGLTYTVTQIGSPYVATQPVPLVFSGLNDPIGVAVDGAGNVYIADPDKPKAIKKWDASTQTVSTLVSDSQIAPYGVAVDGAGNVFFTDFGNNAIKKWNASNHFVSTLVSDGLDRPRGVAVDGAGNVYIADNNHDAVKVWNASTQTVSTLFPPGLIRPVGVAVDGRGNVFVSGDRAIVEWQASTQTVSTLVFSNRLSPEGVAVDGAGNVYFADPISNVIDALPPARAFVPVGAVSEGSAAGADALLPVLPASLPLTGAFAPRSDQSWLTVDSVADGVVHFSFAKNSGPSRMAHITVLGQQVPVTQAAAPVADITITGYGVGYDGTPHAATGTATGLGGVDLSGYLSLSGTRHTRAGSYADSWTFHDPTGTYQDASGTVSDGITPATLTITPAAGQSKIYGAAVPALAYTPSGFVNGDPTSTLTGALTTTATAASPVGSYAITLGTLSAGSNYTVALAANAPTFAVTPAALTVTPAAGQSKVYGAAVPALTYVPTGFVNGDGATVLSGALATTATAASPVGSYAFTLGTLTGGSNYALALPADAPTFAVTPAALTVTPAAGQSKVYGATVPALTYTADGLVNGDPLSTITGGLGTAATAASPVGSYAITLGTLSAGSNYAVQLAAEPSTFAVTPATLTITPAAGQSKVYGATVPALTYTADGLVNGDPLSTITGGLGTAATAASPVGSYAITLGTLSAGSNYTVALAANPPTFAVTRAALTITAANQTKIQGEANPPFTVSYSGFVLGEGPGVLGGSLTFSTPAGAGSPAGSYAITPAGLSSGNYAITFVSGTLTVLGYGQPTSDLKAQVDAAGLDHGMQNSLDSQLQAAIASFAAGRAADGASQLGAFINHVRAQRGTKIAAALADAWIAAAQRIINAVG